MIDKDKATALLELPHLTDNERTYLEDLVDGRLGKWSARQAEHFQSQIAYILEHAVRPLACPNCETPIAEIAARTKDNARDDDHRCPACLRGLRYCVGLIDGAQYWTVQPLAQQKEAARG
jgi:hypothetical protein